MGKDESRKPHVFISYSHNDSWAAKDLAKQCKNIGLKTWIDEEQLHPDEKWQERIENAIKSCNIAIVLLSNDALSSKWVNHEWSALCEEKWKRPEIKIFTVKLEDAKVPPFLCNHETYFNNKVGLDYKLLKKQILESLEEKSKAHPNAITEEDIRAEIVRLEKRVRDLKKQLVQPSEERGSADGE